MSRNTIQQDIICSTVKGMTDHPSPDEVFQAIRQKHPSISRATVYRVLNKLADRGEVRKVSLPGTADRFDFRTEDHVHIRCKNCNQVFDADFAEAKELLHQLRAATGDGIQAELEGFEITGANLSFEGLCQDCRKKETTA